jgi:hypothetical protein
VAQPRVIVRGYREADRAFRSLSRELSGEFRQEMREAAEPIAQAAREKLRRYAGVSLDTIRPVAIARGIVVRQNARKVTGQRPDFGAIQMTRGFIPAAAENENRVIEGLERALDRLTREAGF